MKPPTAGLQREEALGGGGNDECEETNFISVFFFLELRQMFVFLEEREEVR